MNKLKVVAIFSFLLIILALRFFFFYQNQPKYHDGQHVSFETTLLSEPKVVGRRQRFYANLNGGSRIFITTSLYPQFHYGDALHIYGSIRFSPQDKGLKDEKTIAIMSYPKIELVKDNKDIFLSVSSFIRQKAVSLFEKTLPPTSASLFLGIVFGIKESMPQDFTESLRISGAFHVVAASGMNVTLVTGFLSSLFGFFLKRQIATVLVIVGVLFYAVLAGLEPSIIRASIMGILAFSAQSLGRQNLAFYGLFIAAYTMLFYLPILLLDVGFQLSFLATLGLLYIKPILKMGRRFGLMVGKLAIGDDVVTTFSAQITALPVLLANFGSYSLWSILVNALILWTIPFLMVIGGGGALLGFFIEPLGKLILYLALPLLLYFEAIVSIFVGWGAVVNFLDIPWQMIVGYYFILLSLILFFRKKGN